MFSFYYLIKGSCRNYVFIKNYTQNCRFFFFSLALTRLIFLVIKQKRKIRLGLGWHCTHYSWLIWSWWTGFWVLLICPDLNSYQWWYSHIFGSPSSNDSEGFTYPLLIGKQLDSPSRVPWASLQIQGWALLAYFGVFQSVYKIHS